MDSSANSRAATVVVEFAVAKCKQQQFVTLGACGVGKFMVVVNMTIFF